MRSDPTGEIWATVGKMAVGAAVGMASYALGQAIAGEPIDAGNLAISAGEGAITAITGTAVGAIVSGVASFANSYREGNSFGEVLLDTAVGVGSSLAGSGCKMLGGRVKLAEFKNTATKRQLKACGNLISGTYGNQYKNLDNWAKIDKKAVRSFSKTKFACYLGYLGSTSANTISNLVRSGTRSPR